MRECCMNLLALNVGIHNIGSVIASVLNLAGKKADRIPSKSTLANIMLEARSLAHIQLAEEIPQHQYNTLHSDGTTKFGAKYGSMQISTDESSYTLCLSEMKSGSAVNTKDLLEHAFSNIERAWKTYSSKESHSSSHAILVSIKNTMSDRHIVEKNFNQLLKLYREESLPIVIKNWNLLSEDQQNDLARINNFFCGLHFLVGMADSAVEILKHWEHLHLEESSDSSPKESGTIELIRTTCKSVHKHASEKAGCQIGFAAYLRKMGMNTLPLVSFKGNRFNIIFHNSAGVYYFRKHLIDYFESVHGPRNQLLECVYQNLKKHVYIAGCRALGIVSKCITGPESDLSIDELSHVYQNLDSSFQRWACNAIPLLTGIETVPDSKAAIDPVKIELLSLNDNDDIICELLQMLCKSFHITASRLLEDHLNDGEYANPTTKIVNETQSVPATNVRSERDFGILDRLLRENPNASTVAIEALILYSNNQTASWLSRKSEEEKSKLISACIKLGREQRAIYQARREEIRAYQQNEIKKKEEEIFRKHQRSLKQKEELTKDIVKIGLWISEKEITTKLEKIHGILKQKIALKTQLLFRKNVLKQEYPDPTIWYFSTKGKQRTVTELKNNLIKLTNVTYERDSEDQIGEITLTDVMKNPTLLIGRRIEQIFEESDGTTNWYQGTVLKRLPDNDSMFEVMYDDDEETYTFNLMEDIIIGDLRLLQL